MKFTFYLFNESVTEFDKAIRTGKIEGTEPFLLVVPNHELPFDCQAYFQQNKATPPRWYGYISGAFKFDQAVMNQANSFLLLIRVKSRIFAITMGYGFAAIDRDFLERGFGLKVVLNEIDPSRIKSIDTRVIDTTTKQKRVLLNKDSELYDFDFDMEEELLSVISGVPSNIDLANKLTGADSLSVTCDVPLEDLGKKCEQLLTSFYKENYKESFGFIDNLRVIKVPSLCEQLDKLLLQAIENRIETKLMVAYPEIDTPSRVDEYRISTTSRRTRSADELDVKAIYSFLDEFYSERQIPDLQKITVQGFDSEGNVVTGKYKLRDYLTFETELDEGRYVFTLNRWFQIDSNYNDEVSRYMSNIGIIPNLDGIYLPPIVSGDPEGDYNEKVSNDLGYLLLDKKNYPAGGRSKIEICDLYTPEGDLICVKKYNGSSTLSHLFSQGLVSARCLVDLERYRQFFRTKIPENWDSTRISETDFDPKKVRIVFAVACAKKGSIIDSLPFFSKVNLLHALREIERLGIAVCLCKIEFIDS